MEKLKLNYEKTKKAIKSIGKLLEKYKELKKLDPMLDLVTQEALIKRFEYSIDTLWKYLKLYLEKKHGVKQKTPKSVFKEFLRIGLLDEDEIKLALEMIDDRNLTSHTYNESTAEEIVFNIPQYYKLMEEILKKTKL